MNFAVFGSKWRVSTHSACVEHERWWKAEDTVCYDFNQRYWKKIR